MRLEIRTVIASTWITLGMAITTTSVVYNHALETSGILPARLADSQWIIGGMWLSALLCGLLPALMFWTEGNTTQAMGSSVIGYLAGAFIHLLFLKQFLPGAFRGFNFFWNMLTLRGLPEYHLFVLLALIGGSLITCLGVLLALSIAENKPPERSDSTIAFVRGALVVSSILVALLGINQRFELIVEIPRLRLNPDDLLPVVLNVVITLLLIWLPYRSGLIIEADKPKHEEPRYLPLLEVRALVATFIMTLLVLLIAVLIANNYTDPSGNTISWLLSLLTGSRNEPISGYGFALRNVDWLTLPQINMIIASAVGFVIGISYFAPNRDAAAITVGTALFLHVILMLLLDPMMAMYDPLYAGINPALVQQVSFRFFWYGTPAVGAIAAYAMHNLRDAFEMQPPPLNAPVEAA